MSNSFLRPGEALPIVTPKMASSVSQERREELEQEILAGKFQSPEHTIKKDAAGDQRSVLGNISFIPGIQKKAQTFTGSFEGNLGGGSTGNGYRGSGGSGILTPDVYSPLWLQSNMNLPRDRASINSWCRSYMALNPIVQNAISLHSTYPISKLNIKCKDAKANAFFENMIDEIDLMNVCVQIAQEYWTLGEAFVYAELDEGAAKWSRLLIQNPDYVIVQRSAIAGEPVISLRPDENLRRIVTSNRQSDIVQRQQLNPAVVEHIRKGENIPLSNFYVSHLARRISPYDGRGTGLPVSCFRQLMLMDMLRECYSDDTEVLTSDGFKYIHDILEVSTDCNPNPKYVNGLVTNENGIEGVLKLKDGIKVACLNPDTDEIEYHIPEEFYMSRYQGEMYHFSGKKVDCLVTPNHKMWAKKKKHKVGFGNWEKVEANQFDKAYWWKFKCSAKWTGKTEENINICGYEVPMNLYLEVLGYLISEGCIYSSQSKFRNHTKATYDNRIVLSQCSDNNKHIKFKEAFDKFAEYLNVTCKSLYRVVENTFPKNLGVVCKTNMWQGTICNKDLTKYFLNIIGDGDMSYSHNKYIPRDILELCPQQLKILLDALVAGDGSIQINETSKGFRYSTISKQLADDVYEVVWKAGYAPNIIVSVAEKGFGTVTEYIVTWSTTSYGREPNVLGGKYARENKIRNNNGGGATVNKEQYDGVVWCLTVPTGLFVTRRNHKLSIHGNCKFAQAQDMVNPITLVKVGGGTDQYKPTPVDLEAWREIFAQAYADKNFKIFTHDGVSVERVGASQGIYDIGPDITQLIKEIYIGLMVPQVIMDGGGDVTYANGGVTLDVLRQRYMQFRNMLAAWLRRKIFAPISKINDFYEYKNNEKILIVPEVEWNHMSLFDAGDYVQNLTQLVTQEPKKVSVQTLYKSLGLEYEEEQRKIRQETIDMVIHAKELESLQQMQLNELRSLTPEKQIEEVQQNALPGESPFEAPGLSGGMGGGLPGMGGGLPGMSEGLGGPGLGGGLGGPPGGGMSLTPPSGGLSGGNAPPPPPPLA